MRMIAGLVESPRKAKTGEGLKSRRITADLRHLSTEAPPSPCFQSPFLSRPTQPDRS